ncbi:MAG: VCBS repeat-containing protein [Planctomycetes bacterium]|nr:VCBS repeat-containing protein [Planctomycetota bacterium]
MDPVPTALAPTFAISLPSRSACLSIALLAGAAQAQSFQLNTAQIPQGGPANNSFSEHVAFADVDHDGDFDAAFADGGDCCNDQSRLWLNQGAAQGGTLGFFADATTTHFPQVGADSRDIEFVDVDNDWDADVFLSNTSQVSNQSNRWWINVGGTQGGSTGFYQDQTATRWVNVGVNDGVTTFSSVASSIALAGGGFIDWSCDSSFADLDNDGDLDLVQSTYGVLSAGLTPSRIFLNDGQGLFEEFNPSGFQLTGTSMANGSPGLWCEGVQQQDTTDTTGQFCDITEVAVSLDLGDFDGDLDVDILHGNKYVAPRTYHNRLEESGGVLGFRDVSHAVMPPDWAPGAGSYEQELGDFDNDDDLDLYGVNWADLCDSTFRNDGSGVFSPPVAIATSCGRDNEMDFVDFDNDGDLDALLANDSGQERAYANPGAAGGYAYAAASGVLPADTSSSLGLDACDVDHDGDWDLFVANDFGVGNAFLENLTQVPDTTPARLARLEQAPDRAPSSFPTVVRVQVYDNAPWYATATYVTELEYSLDGGAFTAVPMRFSGGQIFRGELPGSLVGTIAYRAKAIDRGGNTGTSTTLSFVSQPTCTGSIAVYCTAKTNSVGCTPAIGSTGTPSASASSGFAITCSNSREAKTGILFYGSQSFGATFQGGHLCVKPPTKRTPPQTSPGSGPCDGTYSFDFNAYLAGGGDPNLGQGSTVYTQWWMRDPQSPSTTGLSAGLSFVLCP